MTIDKDKKEINVVFKLTSGILEVFKAGLSAWETYVATRQQSYDRKRTKQTRLALKTAEKGYELMEDCFDYIFDNLAINEDQKKSLDKHRLLISKSQKKFNKND